MPQEVIGLIDYIYLTFFENIKNYLENTYNKHLTDGNEGGALSDFDNYYEQSI